MDILPYGAQWDGAIDTLLDAAFGTDRRTRTAYRLRTGARPVADLSFVLVDAGGLVASIQLWPVALIDDVGVRTPLTLLGPLTVAPEDKGRGYGRSLMSHALGEADRLGHQAIVLIGDADYYGRFGFSSRLTAGWTLPGPFEAHRLLLRLAPGSNQILPERAALVPAAAEDPCGLPVAAPAAGISALGGGPASR